MSQPAPPETFASIAQQAPGRTEARRAWLPRFWTLASLGALLALGCGSEAEPKPGEAAPAPTTTTPPAPKPTQTTPTDTTPLRVAAASDLQNILPEIAKAFTAENKVEVTLTFGASGQLTQQIKAGAPFDVFLAANRAFVEDLAAGKFVRGSSVADYAQGSLVLAIQKDLGGKVKTLADLALPEVKKIALANPATAPYGTAGKQALEKAGLWAGVEPKIVQAESVRQALQFVESGNAEAGFVGLASARVASVGIVEVDPGLYRPIIQALGVVEKTGKPEAAEAFTRFILGETGQTMLVKAGFAKVDPKAAGAAPAPTPAPAPSR